MPKVRIVRIDDGVRAKLVCDECGAETYVPLIGDAEVRIKDLADAINHHIGKYHS